MSMNEGIGVRPGSGIHTDNAVTFGKRENRIGDHAIEVGDNPKTPSLLSRAGNAIKSFFSMIGNGFLSLVDKISTKYQEYKADREFKAERSALREQLPDGITVSDDGAISGTYTANKYPTDPVSLGVNSGKTFGQTMLDNETKELTPKDNGRVVTPVPVYGGIPIGFQAANDFYRMDMTFGSGQGNFDVRRDVQSEGEHDRNLEVVQGLRAFTGSDQATTILSTVLTQNLSRPLLECFANDDGSRKPMSIEQGKMGGPFHVRAPDGQLVECEPGGIGDLKVELTRDQNGNYEVKGSWTMFLRGEGRASDQTLFHGMNGALIEARGEITFTLDQQYVDHGQLRFSSDPVVNIHFSGQMEK